MAHDIQIKVLSSTTRDTIIVSSDKTPKQVLQDQGIDYSQTTSHLDSAPLSAAEMNKTFDQLGIKESALLACVVKTTNAA